MQSMRWNFLHLLLSSFLGAFLLLGLARAEEPSPTSYRIDEVLFEGFEATDPDWLASYLPLYCPCELSSSDLEDIRLKLMTTQVFQNIETQVEPLPGRDTYRLRLQGQEKWTVIPVLRGAFGGGTPLWVAGIYDTHFLGSLWTLGGEVRTYGSAPTGGVVWARAPRWREGSHYINFELWSDKRIRNLYDAGDRETGSIFSSAKALVVEGLSPLDPTLGRAWQFGLRLHLRQQDTLTFKPLGSVEGDQRQAPSWLKKRDFHKLHLKLVYDNLAVLHLNLRGWRFLVGAGPAISDRKNHASFEQELFFYSLWSDDWNFSWHQWLGVTDDSSYQSLYFLGGLESIRGLPDGVLFGNKAFYTNIELRKILGRTQYAWVQAATYMDYGSAAFTMADLKQKDRATWGAGFRIAVPQVNRLMFRIDYAWSLNRPHAGSISAGMNQFIDPYRPL